MRKRPVSWPPFRTMGVWIVICLPAWLSACASTPVQIPHPVRPTLPMLAARPAPEYQGQTYRALIRYTLSLLEWGRAAESDKAAARTVLDDSEPGSATP